MITIYGDQSVIDEIDSVPVTINVDGRGNESVWTYDVNIRKPNGVREMSVDSVEITATFGEEQQTTIDITNDIDEINLADGLTVNILSGQTITVQAKGVASVLEDLGDTRVNAYIDLAGYGVGNHEVEVKINNTNPLITYVVSSTVRIRIAEE